MGEVWKPIFGGYNHTAGFHDVVVAGSPEGSILGMGLAQAHAEGYGKGVGFSVIQEATGGSYDVVINLNLVSMSVDANNNWDGEDGVHFQYQPGQDYMYKYVLRINYSTDGGTTYPTQVENVTFSDPNGPFCFLANPGVNYPLAYYGGWQITASKGIWQGRFRLPPNTTNISVSIVGAEAAAMMPNYYKIEEIIVKDEDYRPMAIRKDLNWKSLNSKSGFLKIRKGGSWNDIPKISDADSRQANKGSSRVRKNETWIAQPKIGIE